jgi:hypothetical protein
MAYEAAIIKVLKEAGSEGLSVKKIAYHVFNSTNSLFEPLSKTDIQQSVQQYLAYHSKKPKDTIEKVGRGRYRLNMKSKRVQIFLARLADDNGDSLRVIPKDLSLSLF